MTRTLLLGIDGADPKLVEQFDLPNIESIPNHREIDTHGNSGPSWASVLTGVPPKVHGVFKLRPQQDSQSWEGTPIWEKIDGYSGVANVPLTYPPDTDMDGWMVTGLMTPEQAIYTHPRRLYKQLDGMDYRIDMWVDQHQNHPHGHYGTCPFEFGDGYRQHLLDQLKTVIERRGHCFRWLLENEPVDFAFLCFTSLDRVQHLAFHDQGTVRDFYQRVDEQVGRVLDVVDCEVFACSDHGFQKIDIPDTDLQGEHRREGWAASTTDAEFPDLEGIHDACVRSANRNAAGSRLKDLGYLE